MKVLFVGFGSIAKKHMDAIKMLDHEPSFIALRSSAKSDEIPGVKNIFELGQLDVEPDFVIISNPTYQHYYTIEVLAKLRVPLFIEKPLFHTLEKGEELIKKVIEQNINTYVACNLRFLDCIQYVKKNIHNKVLNEVNSYCGSYLPEWRPNRDFRQGYSALAEMGGGVNLDLIHELDYLYYIFGSPLEVSKVFKSRSSLEISATDYANYCLCYERFCASVILNYYRREPKRTFELVYDKETWLVDLLSNKITVDGKVIFESGQRTIDTYFNQMQYFINCLNNGVKPMNSINEAWDVLKICLK